MLKKKLLALLLASTLLMGCAACGASNNGFSFINTQPVQTADETNYLDIDEDVSDAVHNYQFELFQNMVNNAAAQGENAMVSPASALLALCLAENGANGDTLDQIEEATGCSRDALTHWISDWSLVVQSGKNTKVKVSNALWYRNDLTLQDDYKSRIERLQAELNSGAFDDSTVKEINDWCNRSTDGMIPKIINNLDKDSRAVLLNAICFDGHWVNPYNDAAVREGETFTREDGTKDTCNLMFSTEHAYVENDSVTGVIKEYEDGFSFVALLPNEGLSVADCLSSLDGETFKSLLESADLDCEVDTIIPEFKAEYTDDDVISKMAETGITNLFNPSSCDLSGLFTGTEPGDEYIDEVVQKTYIDVNREGTRAAAVTEMTDKATAAISPEDKWYQVRLDRPFIYLIVDDYTKTPVFMGVLMGIE